MCSHYQTLKDRARYMHNFGVEPPDDLGKFDIWPGYRASFIRRPPEADAGDEAVPERQALPGQFGLVPHWATDLTIARRTYNARSETVAGKPSFRDAWHHGQRCIIPAEAFYEPDWRSGKAVPTRISAADGTPLGIGGLWSWWKSPEGDVLHSYAMLTLNADAHALMRHFHKPTDEKRMVLILPQAAYRDWLEVSSADAADFIRPYPADRLTAVGEPR
jgi:putative SOS response-associated peptidase YedK